MKVERLSSAEKKAYEQHQLNLISERNVIETALMEGEAIGMEKGVYKKAIETACKLKKLGTLTNLVIADIVGLSVAEIKKLEC